jgi:hypothetical protein
VTEQDWLTGNDPSEMLVGLSSLRSGRVRRALSRFGLDYHDYRTCLSERKRSLLHCAFLREFGRYLGQQNWRGTLEAGERCADGAAGPADSDVAEVVRSSVSMLLSMNSEFRSKAHYIAIDRPDVVATWEARIRAMEGYYCDLLRDLCGNPFKPVQVVPSWQTPTVLALAHAIYEEKAFDRLPILADALEEAGCDHADVLNHCRHDQVHVRGCWVVDLVLSRT